MSNFAIRWTKPETLMLLPVMGLLAVLVASEPLGIQQGPLRVIAVILAGVVTLLLATTYPAAFVAPVLFLPRLMQISALSGLGPAQDWTELQVAGGLLAAGLLLRSLLTAPSAQAIRFPRRNGTSGEGAAMPAPGLRPFAGSLFPFLFFAVAVAVSYLYTLAPEYGAAKLTGFLTLGCALFLAPSLLFASERDFRDFVVGTALFGMVVAASSLSFSATGAMAASANPSHIGKAQVIGLAILLLLYSRIANRWLRWFVLLGCIPWLALGLVSAQSRGALLSLLLVFTLSLFVDAMASPLVSRRQMIFVAAVLVCAILFMSAFWFYGTEASRYRSKSAEIVALIQGSGEAHGTAVERLVYYRAALDAWWQHPVLGWGIGSWSMIFWQQDIRQYPHNLFFEVLVEQGLAGLAALLLFLATVFKHLRASLAETAARFPFLLPCAVYLLSISMFSGDLDDDRFVWFWCGATLMGCALARSEMGVSPMPESEVRAAGFSQPSQVAEHLSGGD